MDAVRSERAICFASELTSTLTDLSLLSYFPHISSLLLPHPMNTIHAKIQNGFQVDENCGKQDPKVLAKLPISFFRFFSWAKAGNLRGGLVSSSREREMTFGRLLMGSTICKAKCRPISRILAAVCWCKFHQKILYTCAVWADLDPDILVWIAERNFAACFCPICWFFRFIEMRRIWIGWDQAKRQILDCTLSAASCHNLRLIRPPWIISPFYPSLPLVWRRLKGAKSGLVPTGGRIVGAEFQDVVEDPAWLLTCWWWKACRASPYMLFWISGRMLAVGRALWTRADEEHRHEDQLDLLFCFSSQHWLCVHGLVRRETGNRGSAESPR